MFLRHKNLFKGVNPRTYSQKKMEEQLISNADYVIFG